MSEPITCARCGKIHESNLEEQQLPRGWKRTHADLFCPHCEDTGSGGEGAEEPPFEDTLDEIECEICDGPCVGH